MIKVKNPLCNMSYRFPATLENIDIVWGHINRLLDELDLTWLSFDLGLLIREALANAIKHGSERDARKEIKFQFTVREDEIVMEVEDSGDGFDWRKARLQEASSDSQSGRGLIIFDSYATHIEYNDKGNILTLRKQIENK
jgi:anti-sigma regulatory factor (Ser/Thr protein kinase)